MTTFKRPWERYRHYIRVFPFFTFSLVVGEKVRASFDVLEFLFAMTCISLSDRILLVQLYFKNSESLISTLRAFKKVKNMKNNLRCISKQAVFNLICRWKKYGSVDDTQRSGRKKVCNETVNELERQVKSQCGQTSVRRLSKNLKIAKSSVHNIKNKITYATIQIFNCPIFHRITLWKAGKILH